MKKGFVIYSLLLEDNLNINNIPDLNNTPFYDNFLSIYYFWIYKDIKKENIITMILNSNCSKHEDRFYAILPHTKYSYHIKNIDKWKINDMTDVTLKLLEIIDLNDKIKYLINKQKFFIDKLLPSFASNSRGYKLENFDYEFSNIYVKTIVLDNNLLSISTYYYSILENYDTDKNTFPFEDLGLDYYDNIIEIEIPLALAKDSFHNILCLYSIILRGNIKKTNG